MIAALALISSLAMSAGAVEPGRFGLSLGGGFARLADGNGAFFPLQFAYGARFRNSLGERTFWGVDVDFFDAYDDTSSTSGWRLSHSKDFADAHWKATRLAASINRYLLDPRSIVTVSSGISAGLLIWKYQDPVTDNLLKVLGPNNEEVDFKATEIIAGAQVGVSVNLTPRVSLATLFGVDYLTGAGADFADQVNNDRDRLLVRSRASLQITFGGPASGFSWPSEEAWSQPAAATSSEKETRPRLAIAGATDSDGDGVPDDRDDCPLTPAGARVDGSGCPLDSDGDGVADGLDDCPETDAQAAGMVDIYGCPVDRDFDGIPDYADSCPQNPVGAAVDASGCPLDTDADGVPDGLDDCPSTLYGVKVDRFGCIDLSMLDKPMVLNIDYAPGSFEIDPPRKQMLDGLARILNFVTDIKLEISGYTDNIGLSAANQKLSEKRANRVRDYLVNLGVASDRITVYGRGETNFVADNQTAEGRAKNRRIEITFFR